VTPLLPSGAPLLSHTFPRDGAAELREAIAELRASAAAFCDRRAARSRR